MRGAARPAGSDAETASHAAPYARVLGPIAAGFLLDLVDLATYGPIGLWAGLVLGGAAGWLLAASVGVPRSRRLGYALVAGVYCSMPFTEFLPVGTLVGALIRLREGRREHRREAAAPAAAQPPIEADFRSRWDPR